MRAAEGAVEPGEWMGPGYRGAGCKRAHVLRFSVLLQGPGKLRLKASWSAGKGVTRRGLVKVYGLNQLKGWAQEIVVLGMLRKCQNASLLQCLWTANTNPYFETMTMLSGQIVTSEARWVDGCTGGWLAGAGWLAG